MPKKASPAAAAKLELESLLRGDISCKDASEEMSPGQMLSLLARLSLKRALQEALESEVEVFTA
jgi:hypothetical protein